MAKRGPLTILLITAERLVRADMRASGSASACEVHGQPRPAVDDLPSLVEAAIHLSPKKVRRVLVLCSEFWTQTLALPSDTAGGMAETDLAQALAFEAEPFSGVSAFDSLGSSVALPAEGDERHFWFTQVMASVREQIDYVVEQAGGKLVAVAHPAGLPRSLEAAGPEQPGWQRVELWPEAVVCLRSDAGGPLHVHIVNSAPQPGLWEHDAEGWFGRFDPPGARETLLATERTSSSDMPVAGGDSLLDLGDEETLRRWLVAWGEVLAKRAPRVPLVRSVAKPMPNSTRFAIAGLFGVVALCICAVCHVVMTRQTESLEDETAAAKKPAAELKEAQKEVDALKEQLTALKSQTTAMRADVETYRKAQTDQRRRMARMLKALAETSSGQFVLQAIETDRDGWHVRGICSQPNQANALAVAMSEKLNPLGLRVQVPAKEAQYVTPDGGPFVFELLIQDFADLGEQGAAGSPSSQEGATPKTEEPNLAEIPKA